MMVEISKVDFEKVEALRLHLKLRQEDMGRLFGVSRLSYIRWTKGYQPRTKAQQVVRIRMRQIVELAQQGMITPDLMGLKPGQRIERLIGLLN